MPARGAGAPPVALDRQCRKCGADEWRRRSNGKHSCAACDRTRARVWQQERYRRDWVGALWRSARDRAKQQRAVFTITPDDVRAVWPADNRCPVLGVTLTRGKGRTTDSSATLDRLNAAWGYEPGNIAVISLAANRAKGSMQAEELERVAAWMRKQGLN